VSGQRRWFDPLQVIAAHLSVLVDAADRCHHLERALITRSTIGQAIGIIAERYRISADQAFATLRRISQDENLKTADLAALLVQTGDLPGLHPTSDALQRRTAGGRPPTGRVPAGSSASTPQPR
jgi:hypothetical protein